MRLAQIAGWSAALTPLSVILHELGHYMVARAFGYPALLKSTSVASDLSKAEPWVQALQSGAGPIITLIITIAAARLYVKRPARLWAFALAAAAPHRYLVVSAYLTAIGIVALRRQPFGGTPNFDEYNTALSLGVPIIPIAIAITIALIAYWTWLIRRIPRGSRIATITAVVAGASAGMWLWVELATPALASLQQG